MPASPAGRTLAAFDSPAQDLPARAPRPYAMLVLGRQLNFARAFEMKRTDERQSIKVWFWTTLGLGTLPSIVGISGMALSHWARYGDAGDLSGLLNFPITLLFVAALTVWPFWLLGLFGKEKLARAMKSEKPGMLYKTKYGLNGAVTGTLIPYSIFFIYSTTFPSASYGKFDWSGYWEVFAVYAMFLLPVSALAAGFLGYWLGIAAAARLPEL